MPDNPTIQPVAASSLRVDRGARFYKCDFQVHTPRDSGWAGEFSEVITEADRKTYASAFVATCRRKGLNGIAITHANYFKSQSSVARMLKAGLPREIKRYARAALKG